MNDIPDHEALVVLQFVTAGFLCLVVVISSFVLLRKEHRGGKPVMVHAGALVYGLILGGFVGTVMVPLRLALMEGTLDFESREFLQWYVPALAAFLIMLRTDVTARLPLIGRPIRAYRSAMLRRSITHAQKRLAKMERMGGGASDGEGTA